MDSTLYAAEMKHACVFVAFLTQKLNLGCLESFPLEITASSSLAMYPNFRGVLNTIGKGLVVELLQQINAPNSVY